MRAGRDGFNDGSQTGEQVADRNDQEQAAGDLRLTIDDLRFVIDHGTRYRIAHRTSHIVHLKSSAPRSPLPL